MYKLYGAEGGGRTRTSVTSPDFESGASASSTTSAHSYYRLPQVVAIDKRNF